MTTVTAQRYYQNCLQDYFQVELFLLNKLEIITLSSGKTIPLNDDYFENVVKIDNFFKSTTKYFQSHKKCMKASEVKYLEEIQTSLLLRISSLMIFAGRLEHRNIL